MSKKEIKSRAEFARDKGFTEIADEITEMCKTRSIEEIIKSEAWKAATRIWHHF